MQLGLRLLTTGPAPRASLAREGTPPWAWRAFVHARSAFFYLTVSVYMWDLGENRRGNLGTYGREGDGDKPLPVCIHKTVP